MSVSASTFGPVKRPRTAVFVIAGVLCVFAMVTMLVLFAVFGSKDTSGPTDYNDIVVNGDLGAPVILSMPHNFQNPQAMESRVLIEGQGAEIGEGYAILLRTTSFDSRTGEVISKDGGGTFHVLRANKEDETLGDFAPLVIGQKQGTRLLIVRPDKSTSKPLSEIIVMDILYTSAQGEQIAPNTYATGAIPEVSVSEQGVPQIHARGKRINKMSAIPLITGSGGQVEAGQNIAIQYVIADDDGTVIDSTWGNGAPVVVELDKLMEGLQAGLENQKVGSRVLVVIPSAMAAGEGDRIAVVDILAAGTATGK